MEYLLILFGSELQLKVIAETQHEVDSEAIPSKHYTIKN